MRFQDISSFTFPRQNSSFSTSLMWLLLFGISYLPRISESGVVRIGGLFDLPDDGQRATLHYAVNSVNSDRTLLDHVRLAPLTARIPYGDSFKGSRKACSLVKSGVAVILGPQSSQASAHVQSMCDALQIPHIETRWDFKIAREAYSVNLYPHPSTLAKAYIHVLKRLGWRKFCIIYENNSGLIRVQELLKDQDFTFTLRQLSTTRDYRLVLREARKEGVTHIVVDVRRENIVRVLQEAKEEGMMTHYHNYFFTSIDLHTVEMEQFRHEGTNITWLRLVDPENPLVRRVIRDWLFGELRYDNGLLASVNNLQRNNMTFLKTEMALTYDAVQLFAKALDDLDRFRHIHAVSLDCEGEDTWPHGGTLINYMKWIQVRGLTGLIKFDPEGFRRDVTLDIVELAKDGLAKIGRWDLTNGVNFTKSYREVEEAIIEKLHNKTLIITAVLSSPYVMLRGETFVTEAEATVEGFCVDLVQEISEVLGFNYSIRLMEGESHRIFDKNKDRWDGVMAELIDLRADLAIGDLTITREREQVVDFTLPWMNFGISILYRKPTRNSPGFLGFASPLSLEVWLYLATAYLAVSLALFALARFSPYELAISSDQGAKTEAKSCIEISLCKCAWFCFASLSRRGGGTVSPRAPSTRMAAGTWWFFTLVIISSYTANLAAFLTKEHLQHSIQSIDDLAKQNKIKYGTLYGGATWNFFRTSETVTYQTMFATMESATPPVYTNSTEEGVRRVLEGKDQYAYLMESSSIDYATRRHCDLLQVGGPLDSKNYGFAMPPSSPYGALINSAMLKLQERGRFQALKHKWWSEKRGGATCQADESSGYPRASQLGLNHVLGAFVMLLAGMILASVAVACELVCKSRQLAAEHQASFWNSLRKELSSALSAHKPKEEEGVSVKETVNTNHQMKSYGSTQNTSQGSFTKKEALS